MTIHFEEDALEEYKDAVLYSEERFSLGEAFVRAMEAALAVIIHDPGRFQAVGDGVRIFRLKRFPYYLYYHHDRKRAAWSSTLWRITAGVQIMGANACLELAWLDLFTVFRRQRHLNPRRAAVSLGHIEGLPPG